MDLAVSSVEFKAGIPSKPYEFRPALRILSNRSGRLEKKWSWGGSRQDYDSDFGNWQMATTISAADGDGDTYRLGGSPAHIEMDHVVRLDRIIQEPPKHVDYLPTNPDDPEEQWTWEVINVSGYSDFVSTFHLASTNTLTTETTSTSSLTIGGSVEADAKATVTAGDMDIDGVSVSD